MQPEANSQGKTIIGLDLGGTKILAAAVHNGKILDSVRVDTPQTGFDDVMQALVGSAQELERMGYKADAYGIGSPGPLDAARRKVIFAPNISGFTNVPLADTLQQRLDKPVVLENDANLAGYAEHVYGAAQGLHSSVFVTLSTGIGGGIFIGKEILIGAHGMAGEVGHMTMMLGGPMGGDGHAGSLESLAAGRSLSRDASYAFSSKVGTHELFERAKAGDTVALAIVDNAATFTGIGLANLAKIIDPEAFVLGGGLTQVGSFYLDRVSAVYERYLTGGYSVPKILTAMLGSDAGVIGAAAYAEMKVAASAAKEA